MLARQCVLLFPGAPHPYESVLLRAKPLEQMVLEKEHGRMRTLEEAKRGMMMKHNDTDNDNNKPLGHSDIRAHCKILQCILGEVSEYLLVSGLFFNFPNFWHVFSWASGNTHNSTLVSNLVLHKL
jgi:hypothetical protein